MSRVERGGVPAARRRRKVLGRPAPPAALVGPDDVSRQPRGTPPGRARGGPVRQAPDPGGRSRTRPGRPGDRAAVTAGGWSCPHGIVVDPRQPGAAESHAVLRLLGRRPAPGSSPHRQAGVPETRRGGGSGAPGIPPPIERRPCASQSLLFVRRRGCRRRGAPVAPGATGSARPPRVPRWPRRCSARPSARFSTPRRASRRWWTRRARVRKASRPCLRRLAASWSRADASTAARHGST